MHARFEDRLKFQLGIDPATHAALVPTFLLQPLVENAIEHGLGPRMAGGLISIRSRRVGDMLHLCVADNGVGLNGDKARARRASAWAIRGTGCGSFTARRRDWICRTRAGLIVDIRLPFHLE